MSQANATGQQPSRDRSRHAGRCTAPIEAPCSKLRGILDPQGSLFILIAATCPSHCGECARSWIHPPSCMASSTFAWRDNSYLRPRLWITCSGTQWKPHDPVYIDASRLLNRP